MMIARGGPLILVLLLLTLPPSEQWLCAREVEIPNTIREKADALVKNRAGESVFRAHIQYIIGSYEAPRREGCDAHLLIEACGYYRLDYQFTASAVPSATHSFMVRLLNDGAFSGPIDIPDCAQHPEKCDIVVTAARAKDIASASGLETGIAEWRVQFIGSEDGFAWTVTSTLTQTGFGGGTFKTVTVDAHSGAVLRTEKTTAIGIGETPLLPNP